MYARHTTAILFRLLILTFLIWASPAFGEPLAGSMELRGTVGYSNFLDERSLAPSRHCGSARFFVTNRIAVEPEFLFMYPVEAGPRLSSHFQTWSSSSQSANRVFNRMQ
jgi:hypothetical protein